MINRWTQRQDNVSGPTSSCKCQCTFSRYCTPTLLSGLINTAYLRYMCMCGLWNQSLASAQHVALPRYTERQGAPPPPPAPRASMGGRRYSLPHSRHTFAPQSLITAGPLEPFVLREEPSREVDSLYERSAIFERLITGQQSEAGVVPPAYSVTR